MSSGCHISCVKLPSTLNRCLLLCVVRFTKNLAADKISLSTLKGEGDLSDLELDELVLTDLLDLPTWIRLTKATCNRLTIKVKYLLLRNLLLHVYWLSF